MNKRATLLVFLGVLPGCSLFGAKQPDIEIREKPTPVVCDTSARPDALNLKDTPPTLVMDPAQVWGFWFSPDLYGALAENLQAMRRYMEQGRDVRAKLIDCIDGHNAKIADEPPE